MEPVTYNFSSETPLHPKARALLLEVFDQGWSDPAKLSHQSAKARILKNQAIESIAHELALHPAEVEIIGEPALGNFYAISGLLQPEGSLIYSAIDREEVFAIAKSRCKSIELPVDSAGRILMESLPDSLTAFTGVFALQVANGETGSVQPMEDLLDRIGPARIACDFSSSGARISLPSRWDSAYFDAKSWQGPAGIGVIAIREGSPWASPLPTLGKFRTPESASLPLLLTTALSLELWREEEKGESPRLRELSAKLRREVSLKIPNCDIAGELESSLPHITSFSFLYAESEELLRKLDRLGFSVDSGSACTAENLQPSHVLAAMGVLTHGNIRITLHHGASEESINQLISALMQSVNELRAQ